MSEINMILLKLEELIRENKYEKIETEKIELKDLSHGNDWNELYKSVNAFLNTSGGIIIIGVKEDVQQKRLKFTDFNYDNESKIKEIPRLFTDAEKTPLDLKDYINPNLVEIREFLTGHICLIFVEKLPEDKKYVFFKEYAYERQLTGDHRIPKDKLYMQEELKDELRKATELCLVPGATINDLNVDKLNEYIIRLNTDKKVETIKADIESAMSFLIRTRMIRDGMPTLLGMLVCGNDVFHFLSGKCEVDAYFESGQNLAVDQKIYKENIIALMENSWNFIFSKISTGISTQKGGSAVYEYPEDIIRETINNALAHRDYASERFSILRIVNNKFMEIRNPGRFREEQILYEDCPVKIRRIIPIPKARNPNLADILKVYKRWEGRGIGMSTLTNYALNNEIDVPYYRIYSDNEIGLYIPKGKVLDEKLEILLICFQKFILKNTGGRELTEEEKTVFAYIYKCEELNAHEFYTINLTPDNNHFSVIENLVAYGLIEKLSLNNRFIYVYRINPVFKKKEFSKELRAFFGGDYDNLLPILQDILQAVYVYNEYSLVSEVSANIIGNFLYYNKFKRDEFNLRIYNNFKRNIRNHINKLEKRNFILRKAPGKPNYKLNDLFEKKQPSLFDAL